jgi:hypothetical protein
MEHIVNALDLNVVALTLGAAMLVTWEIGVRMGERLRAKGHVQPSKFADASMALLGLLIAFSFGMSIDRHDRRRVAAVADSNAIGDFYTCVTLLNEPIRGKLQAITRQYAQLRFEVARGSTTEADLNRALTESDQMHREMTELVTQALSNGTPIAVSLTNTLNAMISNQASRLASFRDRLPVSIVLLLFTGAVISVLLIGHEQGRADARDIVGTLCFILLVCVAVWVTLDLNRPERGLIRVSQEPIMRLLNALSN